MLHIWKASGEELATVPVEEFDVLSLKQHLQPLCGASRFRQRLLHGEENLSDDIRLDAPMDLQLVLLPFIDATDEEGTLESSSGSASMKHIPR